MRDEDIRNAVKELALPLIRSMGLVLWGVDFVSSGRHGVLRVFLDAENGVDVDQCAELSRHLGLNLDVEDLIHVPYTLEVSSPGMERQFFEPGQLSGYEGREVSMDLREPLADLFPGRKRLVARLEAVHGPELVVEAEGRSLRIRWEGIRKIRLVHRFEAPAPGGPKNRAGN